MKYLIILIVILAGCSDSNEYKMSHPQAETEGLPSGVSKFRDGDVTCYMMFERSLSCVKDSK